MVLIVRSSEHSSISRIPDSKNRLRKEKGTQIIAVKDATRVVANLLRKLEKAKVL